MIDAADTAPMGRIRRLPRITGTGALGLGLLFAMVVIAAAGPFLAPHSEAELLGGAFAPAGPGSPLGLDFLGRDLLSRILLGGRYSIGISLVATTIGFLIGIAIGFTAAEVRGWMDLAVIWVCDILLSFPSILLALLVIAALGSSVPILTLTIAFIQLPRVVRLARSVALGISTLDFVEVARARGESVASILLREFLPNTWRPLAVEFGLRMSFAVLFISALSFLGLGIQPPEADWGSMVRENLAGIYYGALAAVAPAVLIGFLVLGINLSVDWLSGGTRRVLGELQ